MRSSVAWDQQRDLRQLASEIALIVLGALAPCQALISTWTRDISAPFGQSWTILACLAMGGFVTVLWGLSPDRPHDRLMLLWLGLLLLFWLWVSVRRHMDGEAVNYLTLLVPIFATLAMWRPPNQRALLMGMVSTATTTVAVAVFDLGVRLAGRTPVDPVGPTPVQWEWLSLLSNIGESWRGPFGWVSFASFSFTFVLLFGLYGRTRGRHAWILLGLAGILAAQQLGAFVAVALAFVSVWMLVPTQWPRVGNKPQRLIAGSLGLVLLGVLAWLQDPTFHGRTPIWSEFLHLWRASPLSGVGFRGVDASVQMGLLPAANWNAHNWLIDTGTKYGLVPAILVVSLVLVMLILTGSVAGRAPITLAIVVAVTFFAGTDEPFTHGYWTLPLIWTFFAVLLGGAVRNDLHRQSGETRLVEGVLPHSQSQGMSK